jgi:hypothetical protein
MPNSTEALVKRRMVAREGQDVGSVTRGAKDKEVNLSLHNQLKYSEVMDSRIVS